MLQKMIDIVVDEARNTDMTFNASKSAIIRIGKNYKHPCAPPHTAGKIIIVLRCESEIPINEHRFSS